MTCERLASICRLDRRKALEFALAHLNLLAAFESNTPSSPLDEGNTIAIQALVDTSNATGSTGDGDTGTDALDFLRQLLLVTLTEVLDDSSLHGKFDTIEGKEPNEVPYPDDSDPTT
jgi:hypothetical protein